MTTTANTTTASKATELYQQVTDQFISALEQGTVPWQMPWVARQHMNAKRGNVYKGINRVLLAMAAGKAEAEGKGYSHLWLSAKQAARLGGTIRAGEEATTVVLWRPITKTVEDEVTHERTVRTVWLLRAYGVYNLAQTEGVRVPAKRQAELAPSDIADPDEDELAVEQLWANRPARCHEVEADAAWYRPAADILGVPARSMFANAPSYWATKWHEAVHSTGHSARLARKGVVESDGFGGQVYSQEELVAEMGAAFMLARTNMLTPAAFDNSAAYVASWLKALKDDPKMVVTAAQQAEKAARYLAPEPGAAEAMDTAECTALVHVAGGPLVVAA
jgi:antirestriction protein ArdC